MKVEELIAGLMKHPGNAEVKVWVGNNPWGLEINGLGVVATTGEIMIFGRG